MKDKTVMANKEVYVRDTEAYNRDNNDEIVIDFKILEKIIKDYKIENPKLVLRFDEDYYDGVSFRGVSIRQ
jgi:hypothetical protein